MTASDPIGAVMLVRVWEYEVVPGREAEFERLYGSTGAWARLFARSTGHVSTELYRGVNQPARYMTVDRFSGTDSWHRFLSEHGDDYAELDSRCAHLTTSQVGIC
jgi:heme-degrading monooxygenase HmoA